nr:hypothetical protein [Tanacetum cinerariifolium]
MDEGSQLIKDNAERTSSFVVLISLLKPLDPSRWPSPPSNLVVKCLIKLTKDLQGTIYEVDLDHILQSIHVYLQELRIEEIRRSHRVLVDGTGDFGLWRVKMRALLIQHGCEVALEVLPADMEAQTQAELNKKAHSAVI